MRNPPAALTARSLNIHHPPAPLEFTYNPMEANIGPVLLKKIILKNKGLDNYP
jgi:hypothetical protein